MKLSSSQEAIILAIKKGYKTDGINVFSPKGGCLKLWKSTHGYLTFHIRVNSKSRKIKLHRLIAYIKYGEAMFNSGIVVRHFNGNQLDNSFGNIKIGSQSDNLMDRPAEERMRTALIATSFAKKHDHELVLRLHEEGKSYKQIMKITSIKSKGAISFIVNKSILKKENYS